MRLLPLTAFALLCALPAKADTFWLSDPAKADPESAPHAIRGVLLGEDADGYHVRVVGGEVVLAKASVFKIEKDGLTVAAIEKSEKDAAEALALADKERVLKQQIAAKEKQLKAAEAAAKKGAAKAVEASAPKVEAVAAYDPVLGVVVGSRQARAAELEAAFAATGDRAFLKALRQLRRSR